MRLSVDIFSAPSFDVITTPPFLYSRYTLTTPSASCGRSATADMTNNTGKPRVSVPLCGSGSSCSGSPTYFLAVPSRSVGTCHTNLTLSSSSAAWHGLSSDQYAADDSTAAKSDRRFIASSFLQATRGLQAFKSWLLTHDDKGCPICGMLEFRVATLQQRQHRGTKGLGLSSCRIRLECLHKTGRYFWGRLGRDSPVAHQHRARA